MIFCTDVDLLHWEPQLFHHAAMASQTLIAGVGNLDDSTFTLSGDGSFTEAHVARHHVISLEGDVSGAYPILRVISAQQLGISVLYEGLLPENPDPLPCPVGNALAVGFAVRSFWAQRQTVSDLLFNATGAPASAVVMNPTALRVACIPGVLHLIHTALAAVADDPAPLLPIAQAYERQFRRALRSTRVELDTDGDGRTDLVRHLGVIHLTR